MEIKGMINNLRDYKDEDEDYIEDSINQKQ